MRFILILIAALIWGVASWWWYACKVKGFCSDGTFPSLTSLSRDSDGDGIPDNIETKLGLDPNSADSDKDGLSDAAEVGANFETPVDSDGDGAIDALDADDDNDTIPTKDEQADSNVGGDPADAVDTDGDGIPNYLDADSDNDGVSDADEAKSGGDPLNTDSDGDGLPGAEEIKLGTNLSSADSDSDGLSDGDEVRIGTNPLSTDTDGDGITDKAEVGSDPDAPLDSDGDGTTDALDTEDNSAKEPGKPSDEVSVDMKTDDSSSGIQAANIYFPFRSANPQFSAEAESYFSNVVNILTANVEQKISLVGHTDNVGNDAANHRLGLERAKMIQSMLVQRGVSESQIEIASEGETNPIAGNDTQAGRDKNRRVELLSK